MKIKNSNNHLCCANDALDMWTLFVSHYTLKWPHMGFMAFQITDNPTVYLTACWATVNGNMKVPYYRPFGRGVHWWPVDSTYKGPAMRKAFPYHDIVMSVDICARLCSEMSQSPSSEQVLFTRRLASSRSSRTPRSSSSSSLQGSRRVLMQPTASWTTL